MNERTLYEIIGLDKPKPKPAKLGARTVFDVNSGMLYGPGVVLPTPIDWTESGITHDGSTAVIGNTSPWL